MRSDGDITRLVSVLRANAATLAEQCSGEGDAVRRATLESVINALENAADALENLPSEQWT